MTQLVSFLGLIIDLYSFVVIIRVVLSWIPHNPYQTIIRFIYQLTNRLCAEFGSGSRP